MNLKYCFARNLKKIRKQRGLTQEDLAEMVNVAPRHISFIETARSFPSCDLIERLSAALNADYVSFFENEGNISRIELLENISKITEKLDEQRLRFVYKVVSNV